MAEVANPELKHKFIAIDPNGIVHGYDSKAFLDNLKRMHQNQKVSGWQYGEASQYDRLMLGTPKGQNIKNAELIGDLHELKDENKELKKKLAALEKKPK